MTNLIPGKRYRVNYNISVLSPRALESLCPAGSEVDHLIVEPLPDPLPTTPGSVVSHVERGLLVRTARDVFSWTRVHDAGHTFLDDAQVKGATVLFDAGAKRA